MAELPPARVVESLGGIPPGEVRCLLARVGGLGGRGREGDPDPVEVGSGPIPRSAVRLVSLEAAVWEGGRGAPTAEELARESGLPESTVDLALAVLGRLFVDGGDDNDDMVDHGGRGQTPSPAGGAAGLPGDDDQESGLAGRSRPLAAVDSDQTTR